MVSTRRHPSNFPPPALSPSKSASGMQSGELGVDVDGEKGPWAHRPSNLTLVWLVVSLPLVAWDTAFVFLRPHSMAGGALHWPVWAPYELYGRVDHVYGWPAYHGRDGFTGAQSAMNVVECALYLWYLRIVFSRGRRDEPLQGGTGAPRPALAGWLARSRTVEGGMAGVAALIGVTAAAMTVSKTMLYGLRAAVLNEAFSGFRHVGHNDVASLIFLYIIPNGAWIVFPSYLISVFSREILRGLALAASRGSIQDERGRDVKAE
ncbi:MAG: hypothetical protein M1832_003224 [Thelocarpon impressellum]|nr:MAG: hypothetical protein M1832_003224 [Thelocarpon impressellum]